MQALYDLCELLNDDIHEIVRKGEIAPAELDGIYKAVDIIKDIKTIEAMEDYSYDEYSRRNSYEGDNMSYNMSREGGGSNRSNDYSGRRGRDSRGRYTSRDGGSNAYSREYSREGYSGEDKQQMLQKIEQMKKQIEQM